MLFVTLHGGKPGTATKKNNVHAYDKNGAKITSSVLDDTEGVELSELRGLYLQGTYLYMVNANKDENSVLCYQGSGVHYSFAAKLASRATCAGILHPFDLAFDGAGYCYVSSQDTNLVTRLKLAGRGEKATAAPIAPALPVTGKFAPGTFVASSVSLALPSTPIPTPAGLGYAGEGEKKHSVRGVAWINGALYVVDQPAGTVKIYDKNGKYLGQSNTVETPTHLIAHQGSLYVSGPNQVFTAKIPKDPGDFQLEPIKSIKVKNAGGIAFSDSGHFYVASRTENVIFAFDSDFKQTNFRCELPDNPEFLLHV